ncbi:MAG: hypothetical protein L6R38_009395 [Xanthoria sp. 2 TBL-2021]|nr:MAG: hypothetical protein L6R38_009395 [Xanthoria sp. 2 TBL-2021]
MKLSNLFLSTLGLVSVASAQRQVLVTYPNDTPPSIIDQAKKAILATGGKITEEYSLIKSFAATVSSDVVDTLNALSSSHTPVVEDDQTITIQQQAPLEH